MSRFSFRICANQQMWVFPSEKQRAQSGFFVNSLTERPSGAAALFSLGSVGE